MVVVVQVELEHRVFLAHKVMIHRLIVLLVPVVEEQEEVVLKNLHPLLTEDLVVDLVVEEGYLEDQVELETYLL